MGCRHVNIEVRYGEIWWDGMMIWSDKKYPRSTQYDAMNELFDSLACQATFRQLLALTRSSPFLSQTVANWRKMEGSCRNFFWVSKSWQADACRHPEAGWKLGHVGPCSLWQSLQHAQGVAKALEGKAYEDKWKDMGHIRCKMMEVLCS